MSDSADPLLSLQSAIQPPTAVESPADKKRRLTLTAPMIAGVIWLLAAILLLVWWLFFAGNPPGERARNTRVEAAPSGLGPARDYEWAESNPVHGNWTQTLSWLASAKVGISQVITTAQRDPWRDERWAVEYRTGHTLESYIRELDAVGIEIGLVTDTGAITYLSELTNATPKVRIGKAADETRYYMLWQLGALSGADRKLFELGRVPVKADKPNQWVAHFYPPSAEQQMADSELQFAKGRPLSDIRRTVFSIKPSGARFVMGVLKQEYQDGSTLEASPDEWKLQPAPKLPPPATPANPPSPGESPDNSDV